jgi:hypothetical protein
MSSSEELGDLALAVFLTVVIGVAYLVAMLLLGTIRRRPLFPIGERTKIDSPGILYIGIAFFGGLALAAFLKGIDGCWCGAPPGRSDTSYDGLDLEG